MQRCGALEIPVPACSTETNIIFNKENTMKSQTKIITIALAFLVTTTLPLLAMDKGHDHSAHKAEKSMDHGSDNAMGHGSDNEMDHGSNNAMDHGSNNEMDHSGHSGMLIHESTVKGYTFAYHLIDMKKKMKGMKEMPEMKATHHLMLYVQSPGGHVVDKGMAGYMVKTPGGSMQKAMAMAMGGGYGADVTLSTPGEYLIKAKVVDGDTKLMDVFKYKVENH